MEILIVLVIFGFFLTAISLCFFQGWRTYSKTEARAFSFRSATNGVDQMARQIRQCQQIYFPDPAKITDGFVYVPLRGVRAPFVFVKLQPGTGIKQVSAYTLDSQSMNLLQLLYDPGFDPQKKKSWIVTQTQTKAAPVQNFSLTFLKPSTGSFIQMDLNSSPNPGVYPLESKVQVKGGF